MATGHSTQSKVYLSYNSPAEDEFKDILVKDLKEEMIECAISETIPLASRETQKQWSQRKCKCVAAVLILMSNDYQEDEACKADAEAATELKTPIFFLKVKPVNENAWMKCIKGDCLALDLTALKYKSNLKNLIASLKQLGATQGIYDLIFIDLHTGPLIKLTNCCFCFRWKSNKINLNQSDRFQFILLPHYTGVKFNADPLYFLRKSKSIILVSVMTTEKVKIFNLMSLYYS